MTRLRWAPPFYNHFPTNVALATLSSTDPDPGETFTYSLVAGTGDTDNSSFTISGNQLKINASPDYNTKNSYSVRVRTTDRSGLFYEKALTIAVLPEEGFPTDITLSSTNINENFSTNFAIGTLSTTDPQPNNTFTYSLVSGSGDTDNGAFTITGNQIKFNSSPDYETKNAYSLRVRTTDSRGLSYEKAINIAINDVVDTTTQTSFLVDGSPDSLLPSVTGLQNGGFVVTWMS